MPFSEDVIGGGGGGRGGEGKRRRVFAKQGSEYGMPARSKVREREGTTTFIAASGRIPRLSRNVEAARLDPYARYRTVCEGWASSAIELYGGG